MLFWRNDMPKVENFQETPLTETEEIFAPGQYGGGYVSEFFLNRLKVSVHPYFRKIKDLKVSSHLFIDRKRYKILLD